VPHGIPVVAAPCRLGKLLRGVGRQIKDPEVRGRAPAVVLPLLEGRGNGGVGHVPAVGTVSRLEGVGDDQLRGHAPAQRYREKVHITVRKGLPVRDE